MSIIKEIEDCNWIKVVHYDKIKSLRALVKECEEVKNSDFEKIWLTRLMQALWASKLEEMIFEKFFNETNNSQYFEYYH